MQKSDVGLTDPDWCRFLSTQLDLAEVHFWQPHGVLRLRALNPADLFFFFKLRAPLKAIADSCLRTRS